MYRHVSTLTRGAFAPLCSAGLVLALSLCATACTSGNEARPSVDVQSRDAGAVFEPDGAQLPSASEITLQVVGLLGSGLTLRLAAGEDYAVQADGTYLVKLGSTSLDVNQLVLSQPTRPVQTCALERLDPGTIGLTCTAHKYQVSGTVQGLEGTGLVLTNQGGETLAIAASGQFQFAALLDDASTYSVSVAGSVTAPRQMCAVSHGEGTIDGADVTDVQITCATNTYFITAQVVGLSESGLQLATGPGQVMPIPRAGTFKYDMPFPDGYVYQLEISQQPTSGDQRCYVQAGHGQIDGADATIDIICAALSGLRIAEIGSCPFSNSACWFELVNENADQLPEQLGFYKVRTSALGAKAFEPSHVFTLPLLTIPYLGRVVVQAATEHGLPDGSNVVHVADGSVLPWWSSDGFVELLHGDDITTDFVRFGKNSTEPLTGGTWTTDATGSAVQALPTGPHAYGYSLAHDAKSVAVSSPDDWALRAFATFGGLNDVTTDVDGDADGIPDSAEVSGATFSGIDVYSMGARLGQKDVFVEIDRMDAPDAAVIPRREALDKLVSVYKARGIAMHFDVGDLFSAAFDPASYNLGGGDVVPFSKGVGLGASSDERVANLYALKALHMVAARRGFFYYQLFAWSQQSDGSGGSAGIGELL
ncbi:MAG: hypothetical protein JWN04_2025, partial [Myxococcaceae bacterium]|nr:hypothetical protein [Myxococcaceae bacterium]